MGPPDWATVLTASTVLVSHSTALRFVVVHLLLQTLVVAVELGLQVSNAMGARNSTPTACNKDSQEVSYLINFISENLINFLFDTPSYRIYSLKYSIPPSKPLILLFWLSRCPTEDCLLHYALLHLPILQTWYAFTLLTSLLLACPHKTIEKALHYLFTRLVTSVEV